MKKTILGVSIALSAGLMGHSFAGSTFPLDVLMKKKASSPSITFKKKVDDNSEYSDFSGPWLGMCSSENGSHQVGLGLIANEDTVQIGPNHIFQLGSLNTQSNTDSEGAYTIHAKGNWTEQRTLAMNITLIENTLSSNGSYQLSVSSSQISFAVKESKLIIHGNVHLSGDAIPEGGSKNLTFDCTLLPYS